MQKRILFLIATVMMMFSSAMAQITTSGISGKVTMNSNNGEEVIGASILAVHVPSGTRYSAITNVKGAFSIQGMRAGGPYTINISYVGMQTKSYENVTLSLGETYHINVWLKDDEKTLGEVVVKGQRGLESLRTGAAQSINNARLQELPSINHSIADIARINPFVKVTESGIITIAGANNRYNAIQIDGAMSNDVFGLTNNGANGGMTGTQPFSMETIDQLQVSIAPFDVRQSGFTGGSINAITKSGTNEFHGSVYSYFQNNSMISDKYEKHNGTMSNKYGDMTNSTIGATLGGPIIKNKLFLFANFERSQKEFDNPYSSKNGMSKVDFGVAQNILDYVRTEAANQGVNYLGTLGTPKQYTYSDNVGLKFDWNINDRNHAALRWSFVDAKQNNNVATAAQLVTNDYAYDMVSKTNTLVFELNSRIGKSMSNEFHASWTSVREKRNPGNPFPMIQISNVGNGTLCIGNERSSMANGLDQDIYTFTDNFTLNLGDHAITLGTHNELYNFGNLFCQDLYGSYEFSSPANFYAYMNGERSYQTEKGTAYYMSQFRYGQAIESITGTKRWNANFGAGQLGFYIQDKWSPAQNFDLTFGLRVDLPFMMDTPTENIDFNKYAHSSEYEGYQKPVWDLQTNQKIAVKPMWSPRAGFRWDVLKDRSIIVRGGLGIFTGRVPYVWLSNNFSNTGVQQISYKNSQTGNVNIQFDAYNASMADLAINPVIPAKSVQTINVFNKNFKFAQQVRVDLAVDYIDPFVGANWTLEGIYSKTINDMIVKNYDIKNALDKDGKEIYLDDITGIAGDHRPMFEATSTTLPYSGIYVLDNVSKGYSYNISLKAEKSFNFGLDVMASYTYGKSKTINNGSSSVAASNFNYNYIHGNPNEPELANSNFNIPHQVMISAYQHIKWNKDIKDTYNNVTTIGLIYSGNSGSPYTLYYAGDLNGDNARNNDLMYIPTKDDISKMIFESNATIENGVQTGGYTAAQQAENLNAWIENDSYLRSHRGEYFERNGDNEGWESRLDLHIDHKFGFKWGKEIKYFQIGFDIINFTNLLNKSWGASLLGQNSYNFYGPISISNKIKNGIVSEVQYQFLHDANYDMRSFNDEYSRWRMQLTAKFIF